ncbi:hypothetical protein D1007_45902 [Hordeum vulgare]|nr:hypothetical protein D1007_45902 [Hordeum vulgare]
MNHPMILLTDYNMHYGCSIICIILVYDTLYYDQPYLERREYTLEQREQLEPTPSNPATKSGAVARTPSPRTRLANDTVTHMASAGIPPLSLSLSLSLSLTLKQISQALVANSLTHRPGGCHISSLLPRCCQPAIPLPWIRLWRGLGTVEFCSDVSFKAEVWSADVRYEQLLRLSKLLTTMTSLMDGWMLLCDEGPVWIL